MHVPHPISRSQLSGRLVAIGFLPLAQEFLGEGWETFDNIQAEEQKRMMPDVERAVAAMHSTLINGGKCVHGDVRPPNIMLQEASGRVLLVDLDWAGIEGVARYPANIAMDLIHWHRDAGPGKLIMQSHDTFMLQQLLPQ